MDQGLILFIFATLTFYLMYYFYQPAVKPVEQDPRDKKSRASRGRENGDEFDHIQDSFSSFQSVSEAILRAGVSRARLILGIDLTASNEWQGRLTFSRNSLHKLHPCRPAQIFNPYQKVINIIGKTLQPFTKPNQVYAYGFGDSITQDISVCNLAGADKPCQDFKEVLVRYNEAVRSVSLSGPTSFAPIIRRGMRHVRDSGNRFHILVIIADGQMEEEGPTIAAIVEASQLPLSIVLVGVGDGPWDIMEEFDDHLPERRFDNFQFVDFHVSQKECKNPESAFALAALMEIPQQYQTMLELGMFQSDHQKCQNSY